MSLSWSEAHGHPRKLIEQGLISGIILSIMLKYVFITR